MGEGFDNILWLTMPPLQTIPSPVVSHITWSTAARSDRLIAETCK